MNHSFQLLRFKYPKSLLHSGPKSLTIPPKSSSTGKQYSFHYWFSSSGLQIIIQEFQANSFPAKTLTNSL